MAEAVEAGKALKEAPAAVRLWLRPVEDALEVVVSTKDKRLAELTMPEVIAWVYVVGYCLATGMVIGRLAGNLAAVALHGRG